MFQKKLTEAWIRFNLKILYFTSLTGTVVAFLSLPQEVAGLNPFTVMTSSLVTEFSEFSENI